MLDRKEIKRKALNNLSNNWGHTIIVMLLYFVIIGGTSAIANLLKIRGNTPGYILMNALIIFIICIIGYGLVSYFYKIAHNEEVEYEELFSKSELTGKYFVQNIILLALVLCVNILLIIALCLATVIANPIFNTFLITITGVISLVLSIYVLFSYTQYEYITLENTKLNALETLTKSRIMMQGHKVEFFILILSFLPWILLSFITFGIALIFVIPYMYVTLIHYYEYLKTSKKPKTLLEEDIDKIISDKMPNLEDGFTGDLKGVIEKIDDKIDSVADNIDKGLDKVSDKVNDVAEDIVKKKTTKKKTTTKKTTTAKKKTTTKKSTKK